MQFLLPANTPSDVLANEEDLGLLLLIGLLGLFALPYILDYRRRRRERLSRVAAKLAPSSATTQKTIPTPARRYSEHTTPKARRASSSGSSDHVSRFDSIVAVDFETTGVKWPYFAVEIAWINLDSELNETSRKSSLIRPPITIPPESSRIHGISDAMVEDMPSLDEFLINECDNPFADHHVCFIAHNAAFDFKLFEPFCGSAELLCSLRVARQFFPKLPNHRLTTVTEHLGIAQSESHRAAADIDAAVEILRHVMTDANLDLESLLTAASKSVMPRTMPFGKHKGRPLASIPTDYLEWLYPRLELGGALRKAVFSELRSRS